MKRRNTYTSTFMLESYSTSQLHALNYYAPLRYPFPKFLRQNQPLMCRCCISVHCRRYHNVTNLYNSGIYDVFVKTLQYRHVKFLIIHQIIFMMKHLSSSVKASSLMLPNNELNKFSEFVLENVKQMLKICISSNLVQKDISLGGYSRRKWAKLSMRPYKYIRMIHYKFILTKPSTDGYEFDLLRATSLHA